jgi:Ca-activated chloride channel family protein
MLLRKTEQGLIPLPVVEIGVELDVAGVMLRGTVTQTFANPTPDVIEAVYVFPLPDRAAVDAMEIRIGNRRLVAVVKEKEEAKATYEQARQEGRKAGLLDQRRPNLFTASVANINPGETVAVRLEYVEEISWQDSAFSLVFPLTWTPRYRPVPPAGDGAGTRPVPVDDSSDAPFTSAAGPLAPQATIAVRIEAGLPLLLIESPSHRVKVEQEGEAWRVTPRGGPVVADRDFVLRWKIRQGPGPEGALFVEEREGGRYALLMLAPPDDGGAPGGAPGGGLPTETLFIVDVSGSMAGPSIEQARQALLLALDRLRPGDTFNVMKFSDTWALFHEGFVSPRGADLEAAKAWVRSLAPENGTEILPALAQGLRMMAEGDPFPVQRIVMITDGAVSNEEDVLREVAARLGRARLNVVGIGAAPNRYFMRKVAQLGRGGCEFIGSVSEVGGRLDAFLARIDRPVLTELELAWDGAPPLETYPERLPDLHAGEPLVVSLRLDPAGAAARAVLKGRRLEGPYKAAIVIAPGSSRGSGVATRWARAKVESLVDGLYGGAEEASVRAQVIAVAREFNLITRYTSLVAVEELRSATGPWARHDVASALPPGLAPGGELPQGGTTGPLFFLIGLALSAAGALVALSARLLR